jgi:uncharacterized protein YcfJ
MKKILVAIMSLVLLASAAMPAWAQTSRGRYVARTSQYRVYDNSQRRSYDNSRRVYYDRRDDERSFVNQHRDKLTVAGGTAAGAVLGALVGGGRGAAIGALVGAGGSALYTYKLRNRNDAWRYRR